VQQKMQNDSQRRHCNGDAVPHESHIVARWLFPVSHSVLSLSVTRAKRTYEDMVKTAHGAAAIT
jgi:hypothetical protein